MQNNIKDILTFSIFEKWKTKNEINILLDLLSNIINFKINTYTVNKDQLSSLEILLKKELKNVYSEHAKNINAIRKHLFKLGYDALTVENKINAFFGLLLPSNDDINRNLEKAKDKYGKLFEIAKISYYIKYDKKNINWEIKNSKYGKIKMSINKSKPEKTQEKIINAKTNKGINGKPICPICIDNIGYGGSATKPSKENLRVLFTNLLKEKWFFQYSPYSYVNEHFVLNNIKHTDMKIDNQTIKRILEFVNENPKYFLGSNADLPIVGGSLLGHDHYQGGNDTLPIMKAQSFLKIQKNDCLIEALTWPLSTIKISSKNTGKLILQVNKIINMWKTFSNKKIINKNNNTVTLIANMERKTINVYLILRNNSRSDKNPFGNFHIKPKRFNIKQENIGLMEAAGLSILPKRLEGEVLQIVDMLGRGEIKSIKNNELVGKHYEWLKEKQLLKRDTKQGEIYQQINKTFINCLEDCAVFDNTKDFTTFFEGV